MRTMLAMVLSLSACAAQPPQVIEHTSVQKVEVPVLTRETPPAELGSCGSGLAAPAVQDVPGGLLIPAAQVDAYTGLVQSLASCIKAWRVWAAP